MCIIEFRLEVVIMKIAKKKLTFSQLSAAINAPSGYQYNWPATSGYQLTVELTWIKREASRRVE